MTATRSARVTARRVVRRVYEIIGDHQLALPVALAITPESVRSRWVTDRTDLVVEGFPRSGNTFAAIGIATAQRRPRHIVSHAHIPAQVQRAVRLGVATVVVIRDPFDAVCSMGVADSHHRTSDLLRYWVQYHEQIKRFSDDVVIAPFTQVTDQLGVVVTQVNERFDTDLDPFDDEDEDLHRAVFQAIDHKQRVVHGERKYLSAVPRPEPSRAEALAARREELIATTSATQRRSAIDLFERLTAR